jgi:hypothetical protein
VIHIYKIGLNGVASLIAAYISVIFPIEYYDFIALVAFFCSSTHIILFSSFKKTDFVIQALSVIMFLVVYAIVRFSMIGL